ncbi:MAG: glycosyltransferase family 2 protein [Candidatus Thiodiazotropha sp. (ex Notomyrtea botanica)]|nr:glycosyltransferase family 2 protein [Candidatus Thiodiazotropha sp. (ex Notomyrtea botanica)]
MSGAMRVSVIIVTYEWPGALDSVLESLSLQTVMPLEIIVTDDGSGPETREVVAAWQGRIACNLKFLWQEDRGFRAGQARNRGVAASQGDYLVFLDGDCLVFPDFVKRHQALAENSCQVVGNRILLSEALSRLVLEGKERPFRWGLPRWIRGRLMGEVNRLLPLIRLGDGAWRKKRAGKWSGAQSCNLGIWRQDFFAVNGFDEDFAGWGHEDADLVVRLMGKGVTRKDGHFSVPVLHLWHRENNRNLEPENLKRLNDALEGKRDLVASSGVSNHVREHGLND